MATHRRRTLPQTGGDFFLTDGGIETTLIFREGLELPSFSTLGLLASEEGTESLRRYFRTYAEMARELGVGLVLESPTWRAGADWGRALGFDGAALARANRTAVALCGEVRDEYGGPATPVVVSGCVGPRGDGYAPGATMSGRQAEAYHAAQVAVFADTPADMVTAITMCYAEEAEGVARAARAAGLPVALSFTVETDGRLPSGQPLGDAVAAVDEATEGYPSYYMINCAHPDHFTPTLEEGGAWLGRIGGVRANASRKSHAELDEAETLDEGDPAELGALHRRLRELLPALAVFGGCCGTDDRHVRCIAEACLPLFRSGAAASA